MARHRPRLVPPPKRGRPDPAVREALRSAPGWPPRPRSRAGNSGARPDLVTSDHGAAEPARAELEGVEDAVEEAVDER
jgi:hypothetical protein